MTTPFLGEIRLVAFDFPPEGWALCNGQLLPISDYAALYNLIGTTYGGDGQSTFALPNLQGRVPLHQGTGPGQAYEIGETLGSETVTLTTGQLPAHGHHMPANTGAANSDVPTGAILAGTDSFTTKGANTATRESTLTGSGESVSVIQPILCLSFVIALTGVFPSQG